MLSMPNNKLIIDNLLSWYDKPIFNQITYIIKTYFFCKYF